MSMRRRTRRRGFSSLASAIENLEGRVLLASVFQVNGPGGHNDTTSTAMDDKGAFVVAWGNMSGSWPDEVMSGLVRRYDPAGSPLSEPVLLPTSAREPAVAMDADGDFLAAYAMAQDAKTDIWFQRYWRTGAVRGAPIQVSTSGQAWFAGVGVDADGDFVVAWRDSGNSVRARRYSDKGKPYGPDFQVNVTESSQAMEIAVAVDSDGDFAVAWDGVSYGAVTQSGTYMRRYNAAGVAQGSEVTLRQDAFAAWHAGRPSLDFDAAGNFYAGWSIMASSDSPADVVVQRYDAAGAPFGAQIPINTAGEDLDPVVSAGPSGQWSILWRSRSAESTKLYLQRYRGAAKDGKGVTIVSQDGSAWFQGSAAMSSNGAMLASWIQDVPGSESNNVFAWHSPAALPEVQVWTGTKKKAKEIVDNQAAAVNFGTVKVKAAGPVVTFTVKNSGTGVMNLSGVTLPKGFEIVDPLVTSLAPGKFDVFSVRMITKGVAKRSAFVRIASNDADETPFDILVQGEIKK